MLGDMVLIELCYVGVWFEIYYNEDVEIMGKYVYICICLLIIKF